LTTLLFGERHRRHVLLSYMKYYNETCQRRHRLVCDERGRLLRRHKKEQHDGLVDNRFSPVSYRDRWPLSQYSAKWRALRAQGWSGLSCAIIAVISAPLIVDIVRPAYGAIAANWGGYFVPSELAASVTSSRQCSPGSNLPPRSPMSSAATLVPSRQAALS
jgi:hypothetical protein